MFHTLITDKTINIGLESWTIQIRVARQTFHDEKSEYWHKLSSKAVNFPSSEISI